MSTCDHTHAFLMLSARSPPLVVRPRKQSLQSGLRELVGYVIRIILLLLKELYFVLNRFLRLNIVAALGANASCLWGLLSICGNPAREIRGPPVVQFEYEGPGLAQVLRGQCWQGAFSTPYHALSQHCLSARFHRVTSVCEHWTSGKMPV